MIWAAAYAADPDALPTQSPRWCDALTTSTSYVDASRAVRDDAGGAAIVPVVVRQRFGWSHAESMPAAWGMGGLLAPGGVTPALIEAAVDDLAAARYTRLHLRPNPLHAGWWRDAFRAHQGARTLARRAHILDLDGGFERVWSSRFASATRNKVRRAERSGIEVRSGHSAQLLDDFHRLFAISVDRWARQQHEPRVFAQARARVRDPRAKFRAIVAALGDDCRISVAYDGDQPIAAIVVLVGANAHYTRGAMDESNPKASLANRLLHARAIDDACRRGCRRYHMGETGSAEGLARFKSGFGAVGYEYQEYWLERIPVHAVDRWARTTTKRLIRFRDG